jgi:hypothetical protein
MPAFFFSDISKLPSPDVQNLGNGYFLSTSDLFGFKPVSAFHILIILKRVMLSAEVATNSINLPISVHGTRVRRVEHFWSHTTCVIRAHAMNCSPSVSSIYFINMIAIARLALTRH